MRGPRIAMRSSAMLRSAVLGAGLAALLAGDAVPIAAVPTEAGHEVARDLARDARAVSTDTVSTDTVWTKTDWPFPLDQWGAGLAYRCAAADCGTEIVLYLRAKAGFCNCSTGVADDGDLDRVGDLELFGEDFVGLAEGHPIDVGPRKGRSRLYRVAVPYAPERDMLAIGFNDKCDVAVATVLAERAQLQRAERAALDFLGSPPVLRWASAELGAE